MFLLDENLSPKLAARQIGIFPELNTFYMSAWIAMSIPGYGSLPNARTTQ